MLAPFLQIIYRSQQLSLYYQELGELLPIHQYSVDIFSYPGPSAKNQNIYCLSWAWEFLHFPLGLFLNDTESATESAVFKLVGFL